MDSESWETVTFDSHEAPDGNPTGFENCRLARFAVAQYPVILDSFFRAGNTANVCLTRSVTPQGGSGTTDNIPVQQLSSGKKGAEPGGLGWTFQRFEFSWSTITSPCCNGAAEETGIRDRRRSNRRIGSGREGPAARTGPGLAGHRTSETEWDRGRPPNPRAFPQVEDPLRERKSLLGNHRKSFVHRCVRLCRQVGSRKRTAARGGSRPERPAVCQRQLAGDDLAGHKGATAPKTWLPQPTPTQLVTSCECVLWYR